MKKIMFAIVAMLTIATSANAMSYEQARREALFLTDKMAYELNLNDEQYNAAYEINLDYLMGVTSRDDVYGAYWTRRNLALSYILLDWQWRAFQAAAYFYRPLYWNAGYWHFAVYSRYPHRSYFYFGHPTVYLSYRGGHSWRSNGGRSYYYDRRMDFQHKDHHFGMRDRQDIGDFRGPKGNGNHDSGFRGNGSKDNGYRDNGFRGDNNRNNGHSPSTGWKDRFGQPSSTRVTVNSNGINNRRSYDNVKPVTKASSPINSNIRFKKAESGISRPNTSFDRPNTSTPTHQSTGVNRPSSYFSRPDKSRNKPSTDFVRPNRSVNKLNTNMSRPSGSVSPAKGSSRNHSGGGFSGRR